MKKSGRRKKSIPKKRELVKKPDVEKKETLSSHDMNNIDPFNYDSCIRANENRDFLQNEVEAIENIPGVKMKKSGSSERKKSTPKKKELVKKPDVEKKETLSSHDMNNIDPFDYDSCIRANENRDFLQNEVEAIENIPGVIKDVIILIVGDSGTGKSLLAYSFTPFPRKHVSRYTKTVIDLAETFNKSRCYLGLHIFCAPFRPGDYNCFSKNPLENLRYDLVIFIFDINSSYTLRSIQQKWYPEISRYLSRRLPPLLLVGNKLDWPPPPSTASLPASENNRVVFCHEGERCASQIGAYRYIEVSALTHRNIEFLKKTALNLIGYS
ncbi:uncharacterized protein TNCT_344721 [Trichonephila clavata]|uniref:Uncharacterized protein n=1 Tax=Trichonephila clavata TaxID=2740835 RepID=A0A8X6K8K7_TRICU|nr:uncharacterized protein TNCT_344721 [Trichonephila clavata]